MSNEGRRSARICVVDDDEQTCLVLQDALQGVGHKVEPFTSANAAMARILEVDFDVFITDLAMAEMSGLELCERVLGSRPGLPIIVITGRGSMETAISAMRAGAFDFLAKPLERKLLLLSVARAFQHRLLTEEVRRLRNAVTRSDLPAAVIGNSRAIHTVFELVSRIAPSEASVLIGGETGTGKELVARCIHEQSLRREGPFVAINCAAVPPNLIESELFGHARGAFTDARTQRTGLFFEASGGTLFLDEIAEMPLEMQPKLLRALQERRVRPVGSSSEIAFDIRIVAATNRDLEREVEEKRFREDLYYRINVVKISLPALRDRGGDVLELAAHFLKLAAERAGKPCLTISEQAAERMLAYRWPGNVRELENCIERVVALARFEIVTVDDLPEKIRAYSADRFVVSADDPSAIVPLEELERGYICRVLALMGNNKTRTAEVLGIDRRTLYRKLERWGVDDAES